MEKLKKALELRKTKYIKRTGSPGSYKYYYKESKKRKGTLGKVFEAASERKKVREGRKVRGHPLYSEVSYSYLKGRGYTDKEITSIWDKDWERGEKEPATEKPQIPDVVGLLNQLRRKE